MEILSAISGRTTLSFLHHYRECKKIYLLKRFNARPLYLNIDVDGTSAIEIVNITVGEHII
jgi:hypothetical protein